MSSIMKFLQPNEDNYDYILDIEDTCLNMCSKQLCRQLDKPLRIRIDVYFTRMDIQADIHLNNNKL